MARKIRHLRSPNKSLTLRLQLATFERMGSQMAERVKAMLKEGP